MVARPVVIGSHQHWEMVVETGDYIGSEVKTLQGCFEADWVGRGRPGGARRQLLGWKPYSLFGERRGAVRGVQRRLHVGEPTLWQASSEDHVEPGKGILPARPPENHLSCAPNWKGIQYASETSCKRCRISCYPPLVFKGDP